MSITFDKAKGLDTTQNYIYNGDMEVWQQSTANVSAVTGTCGAEGFFQNDASDAVLDLNRSTSVPTVSSSVKLFNYSYEVDVTTADASIGATQTSAIITYVEGNNFKNIHQKQVTLSFWIYATKTGISTIQFANSAQNRCYVAEYTINTTNTWEYKTITLNLDTSGTWLTTSGVIGVRIRFNLACGTTYQGTANTWTGSYIQATSNQVNHLDSTSNFFRITGVKLNLGPVATDFTLMSGSSQGELAICQRYYQTSYPTGTAPGTNGADGFIWLLGFNTTSGSKIHTFVYPVQMCKAPTATGYDYAGNSGKISTYDAAGTKTDNITLTAFSGGANNAYFRLDSSTAYGLLVQYVLNARL